MLGLARRLLVRGEFDASMNAVIAARELDGACDVTLVSKLGREEAKRRSPDSDDDQAASLLELVSTIERMPAASVAQIIHSSSDRPAASLPVLNADFGLPLDSYWLLEGGVSARRENDSAGAGSGSLAIDSGKSHSEGVVSQSVPAASGQAYRLSARCTTHSLGESAVEIRVLSSGQTLATMKMESDSNEWKDRTVSFSVPVSRSE